MFNRLPNLHFLISIDRYNRYIYILPLKQSERFARSFVYRRDVLFGFSSLPPRRWKMAGHKYHPGCSCPACELGPNRGSGGGSSAPRKKSKGGLHAGRPHASKNDSRVHVTTTMRDGDTGKQLSKDEHHSSLGAIAHGWAAYEDSQEKK